MDLLNSQVFIDTLAICLLLAVALTGLKIIGAMRLANKHRITINLRLFSFYSEEKINSTTYERKRRYMVMSNRCTWAIYVCIGIIGFFIIIGAARFLLSISEDNS